MDEYPKMLTKDGKALLYRDGPKAGQLVIVADEKEEKAYKSDGIPVRNYDLDTSHK